MSLTYADTKADIDEALQNSPPVKTRAGDTHNPLLTKVLQHSRDRMADITVNLSGLVNESLIYYDSGTSTWKVRKIQWVTVANLTEFGALAFETDYFPMDYIQITNNGFGQTEIQRYISGSLRIISKFTSVTLG